MSRSRAEVERLVEENMGLAGHIAKSYERPLDAVGAVSEARCALWKAAHTWDPKLGKFSTYAGAFIRNRLRNQLRRQKCKCRGGDVECVSLDGCSLPCRTEDMSQPRPDTVAMRGEDYAVVRGLLVRLAPKDRALITARFMREKQTTFKVLGERFHLTKQALQQRQVRILKRLREMCAAAMN